MPAIDFPSSPTLNQEFTAGTTIYVWDGSVWKVKSSSQPPSSSIVSYSANAPTNPVAGQVWVESDVNVSTIDTTTIYTKTEVDNALSLKANLSSPTFTGTPAAPTAAVDTNTTQIATTAFVISQSYKKEISLQIDHTYSTTLANGYRYFVNTSTSAVSLTLPANPNLGNEIQIFDSANNASNNNITLNRNGVKINGGTDNLLIDLDGGAAALIYTGSTYGWKVA